MSTDIQTKDIQPAVQKPKDTKPKAVKPWETDDGAEVQRIFKTYRILPSSKRRGKNNDGYIYTYINGKPGVK